MRAPFTEPYTRRERFALWRIFTRYNVRRWVEVGVWQSLMRHVPGRFIYFATIHAYSRAWQEAGTKTPDELTFDEVVKPWQPS